MEQSIKDLAYKLDPGCWKSYSGKTKAVKQSMERRRQSALAQAKLACRPKVLHSHVADHATALMAYYEGDMKLEDDLQRELIDLGKAASIAINYGAGDCRVGELLRERLNRYGPKKGVTTVGFGATTRPPWLSESRCLLPHQWEALRDWNFDDLWRYRK